VLAGLIASLIGAAGFLICIGAIVTVPFASLWQYLVNGHLYGQVGANSVARID
jgi:hypothetical protein